MPATIIRHSEGDAAAGGGGGGGGAIKNCIAIHRDAKGRFVAKEPRYAARVKRARVPPGYSDVCVNADLDDDRILWTARDKAGRLQYRYTSAWRKAADGAKYDRLVHIGRAVGAIRAKIARDLASVEARPAGRRAGGREVAAIVGVLDLCRMRVGARRYTARSGNRGATTLRPGDYKAGLLRWPGKSGTKRTCAVAGPGPTRRALALALPASIGRVSAARVNQWLRPFGVTAKDIRTWHANALYVGGLRAGKTKAQCLAAAADGLGHTRSVCKKAYIAPRILRLRQNDPLPRAVPEMPHLSPDERCLLAILLKNTHH